jgi:hypothetical protein
MQSATLLRANGESLTLRITPTMHYENIGVV